MTPLNPFGRVIDTAETFSAGSLTPLKQSEFFLQNYEIVKQFKNVMRNDFSGVIGPAEISNRRFGPTTF
jgi:hypothetical protein